MLKYKPGTKLKYVSYNRSEFNTNDILTVCLSINYPDAYAFKETIEKDDPGWCSDYVEDPTNFILAKIENWKQVIENDK